MPLLCCMHIQSLYWNCMFLYTMRINSNKANTASHTLDQVHSRSAPLMNVS